jgi:hypothetical protein
MENKKRKEEAREPISRKQLDGLIIARLAKETSPNTLPLLQAPNKPGTQPQRTEFDRLTLWVHISDLGPLVDDVASPLHQCVFGQSAFELYGTVFAYLDFKEKNLPQNSRIVVVSFSEDWECALALLVVFANRGRTVLLISWI